MSELEELRWKKYNVGSGGFVCLVDWMGDDAAVCAAARISYGTGTKSVSDDRTLIRYLYRHWHSTPFEQAEIKLLIRLPMDVMRQLVRHRAAHLNEYCLAPTTRVLRADLHWMPIGKCAIGDELVGFSEWPLALRRNRFRVTRVTSNEQLILPCKEVITTHGKIVASNHHQWVARPRTKSTTYKWMTTNELEPGHELAFTIAPWLEKTAYDDGWLAGILDGEGWFSYTDRAFHVGFAQNVGSVLDRARSLLIDYGIPFIEFNQQGGNGNCNTISISRKYEALRLLAMLRPTRLIEKCISHWMNSGRVTAYPSQVISVRDIGEQTVVAIGTDAHTLIAEGFLTHNSTRYSVAIDECADTHPDSWRLQSGTNKQGSSGFVTEWPESFPDFLKTSKLTPGEYLSAREGEIQENAREIYEERLTFGVAREQARKDLPLSNYTEIYWKVDLRNLLHFLSLRMDSHAQLEIREFANIIYDITKQLYPECVAAFDEYDFRRGGLLLSAAEVRIISHMHETKSKFYDSVSAVTGWPALPARCRERDEALVKFKRLGIVEEQTNAQ